MNIIPPKLLSISISSVQPYQYWTINDNTNDPWLGYPYRCSIILNITLQPHSSGETPTPFYYTGNDIIVGDWLCSNLDGASLQITEIINQSISSATVIVEDIERFNTIMDPTQSGNGGPNIGPGVIFEMSPEGIPILIGVIPGALPDTFQTDIISRFQYRNLNKKYIRVYQTENNLSIGEIIFINSSGIYQTIVANVINKNNFNRIVGSVNSVNIPGPGWFTYEPKGVYQNNNTSLPDSNPGDLIYLDPVNSGGLTTVSPNLYAIPLYIRISATEVIFLNGGSGSGTTGPLGYYATIYTVPDINTRNSLNTTLIEPGDQVFVASDVNGWGYYIASSVSSDTVPVVTWTNFANISSAASQYITNNITITYQSSPEILLTTINPLNRVAEITINVTNSFHPSATLTIGDSIINNSLVTDVESDLYNVGIYSITPNYQYSNMTDINVYLNVGPSTTGSATISISVI